MGEEVCVRSLTSCASSRMVIFSRQPRLKISRAGAARSEEHTSELQSRLHLVCRLLLEKKKRGGIVRADPVLLHEHFGAAYGERGGDGLHSRRSSIDRHERGLSCHDGNSHVVPSRRMWG